MLKHHTQTRFVCDSMPAFDIFMLLNVHYMKERTNVKVHEVNKQM